MLAEPFAGRFNESKRQECRDCLLQTGTMLTDYEVQNLFYALVGERHVDPVTVRFVEPTLIELMMCDSDLHDELYALHIDSLRRDMRDGTVLLLPLCHDLHWSLLILRTQDRRWVHMDSLDGYHWPYARQVLLRLVDLGLCHAQDALSRLRALPRQRHGWECGLYVLFYALVVALSPDAPFEEWQREGSYMCEESRFYFTQSLLVMLNKPNIYYSRLHGAYALVVGRCALWEIRGLTVHGLLGARHIHAAITARSDALLLDTLETVLVQEGATADVAHL